MFEDMVVSWVDFGKQLAYSLLPGAFFALPDSRLT
jgi:hypothetical protein